MVCSSAQRLKVEKTHMFRLGPTIRDKGFCSSIHELPKFWKVCPDKRSRLELGAGLVMELCFVLTRDLLSIIQVREVKINLQTSGNS
jgi:hypothetical protein